MAGRPSIYSEELAETICTRLAGGESLRSICRDEDMPALSTVLLWVVDGRHEAFSVQYAQAREANGQAHGDRVLEIVDKVLFEDLNPQSAKVAIDGLKWSAERMAPKQYAPRNRHELTGEGGSPLQIILDQGDQSLL